MGDNKVYLEDKGETKSFQINVLDKDGTILYSSKVKSDEYLSSKDLEEYQKVIDNQQNIIEVMTEKLKNNKIIMEQLNAKNKKYEEVIKKLIAEGS